MATLYDILGITTNAKPRTVRMAYRRLARQYHPDVNPDPSAHERMAEINAAFDTLIDPVKRQEYDAALGLNAAGAADRARAEDEIPGTVRVRLARRLAAHRTPIYSFAFTPDSHRLVSVGFDNEVLFWDAQAEKIEHSLKLEGGVVSTLRAVSGGRLIAAGCTEGQVSIWVVENGHLASARHVPIEWVCSLALSPDGTRLAMGSIRNQLLVLRVPGGQLEYTRATHSQSVTSVTWSPDGRLLISGGADAVVRLWASGSGRELHALQQVRATVTSLSVSPRGNLLAVGSVDRTIRLFDLTSLQLLRTFSGHERPIESLDFHPSGLLLASAGRDGVIGLWNAVQGMGHGKIEASPQPLAQVAFHPTGHQLVAGGMDKQLRIWDLKFGPSSAGARRVNSG